MSAALQKDLKEKHKVGSMPIRKGDRVRVVRGDYADKEGKVEACYRRKWVIHVEGVTVTKHTGEPAFVGIHPSNVVISELHMDKDRLAAVARRSQRKVAAKNDDDVPDLA